MKTRHRIIMYEKTTDREGGIIAVQPALERQALAIAGVSNGEPGETELNPEQAREIGNLLGFRSNSSRYVYHLETLGESAHTGGGVVYLPQNPQTRRIND